MSIIFTIIAMGIAYWLFNYAPEWARPYAGALIGLLVLGAIVMEVVEYVTDRKYPEKE